MSKQHRVIPALLMVIVFCGATVFCYLLAMEHQRQAIIAAELKKRVDFTFSAVLTMIEKIEGQDDKLQVPSFDGKDVDAWGNKIEVIVKKGGLSDEIVVRSPGPDGLHHTEDDLSRSIAEWKVAKGLGNLTKEQYKGWIEGIKEGIFGKSEEKKEEAK